MSILFLRQINLVLIVHRLANSAALIRGFQVQSLPKARTNGVRYGYECEPHSDIGASSGVNMLSGLLHWGTGKSRMER